MPDGMSLHIDRRQSKAIIDSFERLSGKAARTRVMRTANNKAARPWRMAAKRKLAASNKTISKMMVLVTRTYKNTGTVATYVGVNKRSDVWKAKNYPTNLLELIEFGTQRHTIIAGADEDRDNTKTYRGGGKRVMPKFPQPTVLSNINTGDGGEASIFGPDVMHPGTPPRPFMRPAFQENLAQVIAIHERETAAGITKEFMKGVKK